MTLKSILFICTENAGRSQMAEAFANFYGGADITAYSAGSRPAGQVNPVAVEAMKEINIDLSGNKPKGLAEVSGLKIDYAVTMGCGDTCPFIPEAIMLNWTLADPKGQPLEQVRLIRDEIEQKVLALIKQLK
ncbi:MAG: arsenate reductase ArsC [bacterium]|nr:arsenate reductase ArsC [bacterium]